MDDDIPRLPDDPHSLFSTLTSGSEKKNTTNKVKTLGQNNNMRKKAQHFSVTAEKRSEVL
jgi:hypothetical protein